MSLESLRERVCRINRELAEAGLARLTWGNASGIDRETEMVAIKPSGVPYHQLRTQDIVLVPLAAQAKRPHSTLRPSSDTPTHLELYRAFPSLGGIVHTHSRFATVFAQAHREIPCLGTTHADHFYGKVPLAATSQVTRSKQSMRPTPAGSSSSFSTAPGSTRVRSSAQMAFRTLSLNPGAEPLARSLPDKHFLRKHGPQSESQSGSSRGSPIPTMRAAWLQEGTVQVRQVPLPRPPPTEALIRMQLAGICNTDLELIRGYFPFTGILGHEFVGTVVQGPAPWPGKRVVGEINAGCGRCRRCRQGEGNHCPQRTVLGIVGRHGAFAQYLTLPLENLHIVPSSVSLQSAVFTEPLAAALRIRQQVDLDPASRVLVVGDGKLGQLIAQTLHLTSCPLHVVGRHPAKLRRLKRLGVNTCLEQELREKDFQLAVECTGNPEGFGRARRSLAPGGTLVLKSTYADRLELDASALVVDEIRLLGSRCGPFPPALQLLQQGKVEVESLIQARFPLSEACQAIDYAGRSGVLKVLIEME